MGKDIILDDLLVREWSSTVLSRVQPSNGKGRFYKLLVWVRWINHRNNASSLQ
ncbi:MAG: hypothetical protein HON76_07955 [Candidatus Scalindua sp.]|nr:hypothetical protein [Candidatus Scalindua sp.]MBT5303447.1 hypothetical protein [Candidatus Scalindua sp.]MBT6227307.1 hypothetical protein [Candidatus Scalindua sp.]MBT6562445.1 hypothetical protein [Candidatus Scalindua sp.]MBT7212250.1 hypothetical protein [Candidatus Scalindua sp.]